MASNLSNEFHRFARQARQLKQILKDTNRCFHDINTLGNFEGAQLVSADFSQNEEDGIVSSLARPPTVVILGQTAYAKAFLANEILNKKLFPIPSNEEEDVRWRMVRIKYGSKTAVSLSLPDSFELVDNLVAHNGPWKTIPVDDLEVNDKDRQMTANASALLDLKINHTLLRDGVHLVVTETGLGSLDQIYCKCMENVVPICIYAISKESLSEQELSELKDLKQIGPEVPVFFMKVPAQVIVNGVENSLDSSSMKQIQQTLHKHNISSTVPHYMTPPGPSGRQATFNVFQQLLDIGYLSLLPSSDAKSEQFTSSTSEAYKIESELIENFDNFSNIIPFARQILQVHLIRITSMMNLIHTRCLQMFIVTAFDMARDMMITPKRLEFAKDRENDLYSSLMEIAIKKQDEIKKIIQETISMMRDDLLRKAEYYDFIGVDVPESGEVSSSRDLKICTGQIKELVLGNLNSAIAGKLMGSVDVLKDSYTGVLTRCLESLEASDKEPESTKTTLALREIINSAYQVEITCRAGSSLVKVLLEKMKQLIHSMPWKTPPKINCEWKRRVAADMLDSLSEARLAKSICAQIKERLKQSHEHFSAALKQLEERHSGRLEKTEEQRLKVRKVHAPKVARLALESTSLRDYILFGMPNMGREVGRGQYGVVYSCDNWAGFSPCAIKSVVPPDDKHWNDLALEFYYTKNVPEHDRVVALRGSVIDYTYGGGTSPAVLLVMDRLQRDLYAAIKSGLEWPARLQVSIDVVEGMRFLHSQGLVHRDIKLKNVLLDKKNRGKITDLGFCKPEAMMSGSIVGTPIHMAPELFSGRYDNSVDVYAFGILFWYVCAGHVRLPYSFEQCTSKDMLWTSVKRGARPEKLSHFDDRCWSLMSMCWEGEPDKRPLLGHVQPKLEEILDACETSNPSSSSPYGVQL